MSFSNFERIKIINSKFNTETGKIDYCLRLFCYKGDPQSAHLDCWFDQDVISQDVFGESLAAYHAVSNPDNDDTGTLNALDTIDTGLFDLDKKESSPGKVIDVQCMINNNAQEFYSDPFVKELEPNMALVHLARLPPVQKALLATFETLLLIHLMDAHLFGH